MTPSALTIRPARGIENVATIAELFRYYEREIGVDLCFQGFAEELSGLPAPYEPPLGELLLACGEDGQAIGCVALKPHAPPDICEMKRLFVVPAAQGLGLGPRLIEAITNCARTAGYKEIRLDSLPTMTKAVRLYRRFGFRTIEPYYVSPIEGTHFLGCQLI